MAAAGLYLHEGDYQPRVQHARLLAQQALPASPQQIQQGRGFYADWKYGDRIREVNGVLQGARKWLWDQVDYALAGFRHVYHVRLFNRRAEELLASLQSFYGAPGGQATCEQFVQHLPIDDAGRAQLELLSMGCGSGACAVAVEAWFRAVLVANPHLLNGVGGVASSLDLKIKGMDRQAGWRSSFESLGELGGFGQLPMMAGGNMLRSCQFTRGNSFGPAGLNAARSADILIFSHVIIDFLAEEQRVEYFTDLIGQWEEQEGPPGSFKLLLIVERFQNWHDLDVALGPQRIIFRQSGPRGTFIVAKVDLAPLPVANGNALAGDIEGVGAGLEDAFAAVGF